MRMKIWKNDKWKEKLVVSCYCPNELNLRPKKYARKKSLPVAYMSMGKIFVSPKTWDLIKNNSEDLKEMYIINYE